MSTATTALENLIGQGIPKKMAERIIAQATKETAPKGEKKKKPGRYFPGMSNAKKKIDLTIDVLVVCECCGHTEAQTRVIQGYEDSPKTMKTATSICSHCPDFFRQLTHEQLVSLAIAKEHPGIKREYKMNRSHITFAMNNTPEQMVLLKLNNF